MTFLVTLVSIALLAVPAQKKVEEKDFLGTWVGGWTGPSSGTFEMTITKDKDGKLGGSVSPKPDNGDPYTSQFTSVVFADGKMTIKMNNPGGDAEITLIAGLEAGAIKGEYIVRQAADGTEIERGTVTAKKKS